MGANLLFCTFLAENCMKMKEFGLPGGEWARVPGPLGSANADSHKLMVQGEEKIARGSRIARGNQTVEVLELIERCDRDKLWM